MNATGWVATRPDGTRLPGAMAAFLAVVLAVLGFVFLLAVPTVRVDDRGELMPDQFVGLYREARSHLPGGSAEMEDVTVLEAQGSGVILALLMPVVMTGFAWYMHRKTGISRPLTIGMVALAVVVLFTGYVFILALIALAVGSFQARKAELPARMAERMSRDQGDGEDSDVIDVESAEEDEYEDEPDEDEYDEELDEYEDDEELDEDDEEDEEGDEGSSSNRRKGRRWGFR